MGVSGTVPVMEIRKQDDGSVSLWLSLNGGSGETVTVVRAGQGWRVTNVVGWVA
jgi:hypothetical protein